MSVADELLNTYQVNVQVHGVSLDTNEFARRLWGDIWYWDDTGVFRKKRPPAGGEDRDAGVEERSFVRFILLPLYKIYSQVSFFQFQGLSFRHQDVLSCIRPWQSCVDDG